MADEPTTRQINLSLGDSVYDPTDAVGRLLSNVLAMVAEFESRPHQSSQWSSDPAAADPGRDGVSSSEALASGTRGREDANPEGRRPHRVRAS
ncbi:MAG: hypothetical protein WBQ50_18400 [Nocardioides sp.]